MIFYQVFFCLKRRLKIVNMPLSDTLLPQNSIGRHIFAYGIIKVRNTLKICYHFVPSLHATNQWKWSFPDQNLKEILNCIFSQESLKSEEIAASKPAKDFHAADLKDLKSAIASLGGKKSEAQEIKILKKELEDYEEDLKDLHKVKKTPLLNYRSWLLQYF